MFGRTTRSQIVGAALGMWLLIIFGGVAGLFAPHAPADVNDVAAMDHYTHAIWFLIFVCCTSAIGLAWWLNKQPLMGRVEERLCQFGTGIANLTAIVYFVALPVFLILEFLQPSDRVD